MVQYEDILRARDTIGDSLARTPLVRSSDLEDRLGRTVWLKCELLQMTGSFKPRGALNWIRNASKEQLERGLIAVSAGNHAKGLAWAARAVGAPLTVVMPANASPAKAEATQRYGAEVILHGDINEAWARAHELRERQGLTLVHPYDDPTIIAGQGTIALEILEQGPAPDVLICPVGGGGLISGIGIVMKHRSPRTRIIGVEPEGAPTMRHAWERGGPEQLPSAKTVAASLGANIAGEHTYEITRRVVDEFVTCTEEEIRIGTLATMTEGKLYAEPGGAIPIAALLAGRISLAENETVAVVISGGNFDLELLKEMT